MKAPGARARLHSLAKLPRSRSFSRQRVPGWTSPYCSNIQLTQFASQSYILLLLYSQSQPCRLISSDLHSTRYAPLRSVPTRYTNRLGLQRHRSANLDTIEGQDFQLIPVLWYISIRFLRLRHVISIIRREWSRSNARWADKETYKSPELIVSPDLWYWDLLLIRPVNLILLLPSTSARLKESRKRSKYPEASSATTPAISKRPSIQVLEKARHKNWY